METMLNTTFSFLKENKEATFNQVWNHVVSEKKAQWKEENTTLSVPQLEEKKKGELYTLMTVDGRFIKLPSNKWGLVENFTFTEVRNLRTSAVENDD